jgi:hypothetical protein
VSESKTAFCDVQLHRRDPEVCEPATDPIDTETSEHFAQGTKTPSHQPYPLTERLQPTSGDRQSLRITVDTDELQPRRGFEQGGGVTAEAYRGVDEDAATLWRQKLEHGCEEDGNVAPGPTLGSV